MVEDKMHLKQTDKCKTLYGALGCAHLHLYLGSSMLAVLF